MKVEANNEIAFKRRVEVKEALRSEDNVEQRTEERAMDGLCGSGESF